MPFRMSSHPEFKQLQNLVKALTTDMTRIARIGDRQSTHILKLLEMLKSTGARILVLEGASGLTEEDLMRGYSKAMDRLGEVERDIRAAKEPPPFKPEDFGDPQ